METCRGHAETAWPQHKCDEADKLFGSFGGGPNSRDDSSSGTGMRMLQILLTYLQERNTNDADRAYIMATFNNGWFLPDAIIRPGRFNSRVWLDLPSEEERKQIFSVHLKKRFQDPAAYDLGYYAKFSPGCTGAEIEFMVSEGLKACYDKFDEDFTPEQIHAELKVQIERVTPQSKKPNSEYHAQTQWAASSGYIQSENQKKKKVVDGSDDLTSLGSETTANNSEPPRMVPDTDDDYDNRES